MKNIEEMTFTNFILKLKGKDVFKGLATNGLTEAKGEYLQFPVDIRNKKLGDIKMGILMRTVQIDDFRHLKKVGAAVIERLKTFVDEDGINWPGPTP